MGSKHRRAGGNRHDKCGAGPHGNLTLTEFFGDRTHCVRLWLCGSIVRGCSGLGGAICHRLLLRNGCFSLCTFDVIGLMDRILLVHRWSWRISRVAAEQLNVPMLLDMTACGGIFQGTEER